MNKTFFQNKTVRLLPFVLLFLLAFFLRGQETLSNNYLFLKDQGRDMLKVKEIVFDHHLTLIGPYTSLGGVFQGPFYYYLLAIPTFFFRGDPLGAMILMFGLSLATVAVATFWIYKLFGYAAAFSTMALFTVSAEAIAAATYIWNPHPMWLLITLFAFSLYSIKRNIKIFLPFSFLLLSLMFHFEAALAVFLTVATVLYVVFFERKCLRSKYLLIAVCIFTVCFIPQAIFDMRHNFLMSRSVVALFSHKNDRGLTVKGESTTIPKLFDNHIGVLRNNYVSSFPTDKELSLAPVFFAVFLLLIFIKRKAARKEEFEFISVMLSIVVFTVFFALLYPFPLRYWFFTGFQSFYLLIFGILLGILLRNRAVRLVCLLLFLLFSLSMVRKLDMLYIHPPDNGGVAKTSGKKAAIDYIYADAKNKPFGLLVFTPPVYTDAYDYLIWWYGKKTYGYVPSYGKKATFYLLIEPDPDKPWSYKGWLETVVKTGSVVETKTLPSGLIVQKRISPS